MPIFPFFARHAAKRVAERTIAPARGQTPTSAPASAQPDAPTVRRHFYNEPGFQTYASFFPLWGGWATAGHCMTDASELSPPFADGAKDCWPGGLDGALIGCALPRNRPTPPRAGQRVVARGFPAGSHHMEERAGTIYIARMPGQWIVKLDDGEEPVVTGMSGGPVVDAATGEPLGILITRNSPADLDADGDADESFDFTALGAVWDALQPTA